MNLVRNKSSQALRYLLFRPISDSCRRTRRRTRDQAQEGELLHQIQSAAMNEIQSAVLQSVGAEDQVEDHIYRTAGVKSSDQEVARAVLA